MIDSMVNLFQQDKVCNKYLIKMYHALFVTTYFGLFRIGEVTTSDHVILAKDVHMGKNKKKLMFVLHSSKTHWKDSKPQIVKISSTDGWSKSHFTNMGFCLFEIIKMYLDIRKKRQADHEQFFSFSDRSPVKPLHFRFVLRKLIIYLNLDPDIYQVHGFRAGRATDMADMGISVETIKKLGWWKSSAVYNYLQ